MSQLIGHEYTASLFEDQFYHFVLTIKGKININALKTRLNQYIVSRNSKLVKRISETFIWESIPNFTLDDYILPIDKKIPTTKDYRLLLQRLFRNSPPPFRSPWHIYLIQSDKNVTNIIFKFHPAIFNEWSFLPFLDFLCSTNIHPQTNDIKLWCKIHPQTLISQDIRSTAPTEQQQMFFWRMLTVPHVVMEYMARRTDKNLLSSAPASARENNSYCPMWSMEIPYQSFQMIIRMHKCDFHDLVCAIIGFGVQNYLATQGENIDRCHCLLNVFSNNVDFSKGSDIYADCELIFNDTSYSPMDAIKRSRKIALEQSYFFPGLVSTAQNILSSFAVPRALALPLIQHSLTGSTITYGQVEVTTTDKVFLGCEILDFKAFIPPPIPQNQGVTVTATVFNNKVRLCIISHDSTCNEPQTLLNCINMQCRKFLKIWGQQI